MDAIRLVKFKDIIFAQHQNFLLFVWYQTVRMEYFSQAKINNVTMEILSIMTDARMIANWALFISVWIWLEQQLAVIIYVEMGLCWLNN